MKLCDGPKRLSRLRREIDEIPKSALVQTLRKLERDGAILERRVLTIPPSITYELTDLGRAQLGRIAVAVER